MVIPGLRHRIIEAAISSGTFNLEVECYTPSNGNKSHYVYNLCTGYEKSFTL